MASVDLEVLGPFLPLSRMLGRLVSSLAAGQPIDRVEVEYLGRIADRDCPPLTTAVLLGIL
ncbi:MAG: phosphoglycerate dehydrogenase, partial [Solirubrobacterales bacterium]